MIWAPALIITSAVLAVAALACAARSVRAGSTGSGCAALLLSLAAFWTTVGAGVCLFAGV